MQEYDVALKLLLRGSARLTMRELTDLAARFDTATHAIQDATAAVTAKAKR